MLALLNKRIDQFNHLNNLTNHPIFKISYSEFLWTGKQSRKIIIKIFSFVKKQTQRFIKLLFYIDILFYKYLAQSVIKLS